MVCSSISAISILSPLPARRSSGSRSIRWRATTRSCCGSATIRLNTGVITAAFHLIDNGVVTSTTLFSSTGTIFEGENWTRAQIIANGAPETISVRQGTYSTLTVDQDGDWVARTRNGQSRRTGARRRRDGNRDVPGAGHRPARRERHRDSDRDGHRRERRPDHHRRHDHGFRAGGRQRVRQRRAERHGRRQRRHPHLVGGGEAGPHIPDYHVELDNFTVIKNGSPLFDDTFGDGNPPPSAPNFTLRRRTARPTRSAPGTSSARRTAA